MVQNKPLYQPKFTKIICNFWHNKNQYFPNNVNYIVKVSIFCRPEEAMLDTGESLSYQKKYFLILEKIEPSSTLNNVSKQIEKYSSIYKTSEI